MDSPPRPLRLLLALAITVALGIASRLAHTGSFLIDKTLGVVLYAVAVHFTLALFLRRTSPRRVALLSLIVCWAIELFQATGIPARHAELAVVRWLVGTTFSWHDVACYPLGVAVAFLASQTDPITSFASSARDDTQHFL
ncbi:MAG: DUF2809 domain-containing protein [Planctomycetota bacterium]